MLLTIQCHLLTFFTDKLEDVAIHGTLPSIADHEGIICVFTLTEQKATPRTKTIYDYKNVDLPGLKSHIKHFNFESTVFSLPVIAQTQAFTDVLTQALHKFIPCKTVTIRPNEQSWCNSFTRLLLRKKNRKYQFFKKVNSKYISELNKPITDTEYLTKLVLKKTKAHKIARNAANQSLKENRRAKNNFFSNVNETMNNINISAKKKFNILSKLMKTNKFTLIPPLVENNSSIQDPSVKSNILNKFFSSKSTVQNPNDEPPTLDKKEVLSPLGQINTSPIEVGKLIRSLKKSHLSHCGIPGKFLDLISSPLSKPMSTLFNHLFESSHYPDKWELSHVTPIYKRKGDKCDKSSYRPISLLPTISKVCESVIHERLLSHCTANNIISDRQGAYLKGDSTIHQLLYIIHHIRKTWGSGNITHGVFLDISAAFDKIWHNGLIAKLNQIGVEDKQLNLFKSYLDNRKQIVVVDGIKSETESIKAGCPQGSRLGPLLFIIYINDLTENLESDIIIFADDTTILATGRNSNETSAQLGRDLNKIKEWALKWKISFNATKTKDMIFTNKTVIQTPALTFDNTNIKRVTSHRHLGIILTSTLDWALQVNDVCLRANRKLNVLKSIKFLNRKTLDILYKLTIRSVTDYGLPIFYNNLRLTEKRRISQLQYRAAKFVTGALHLTSQVKLEQELAWESCDRRADILGLAIFHKIHLHETRPLIRTCMQTYDIDKRYLLRSNGGYIPFNYINAKFHNSFFPYYTRLWNSLKKTDRQTGDMLKFKENININLKPTKIKHNARGSKYGNMLITRLRVCRSFLNGHSYTIGLSPSPSCDCGAPQESSQHVLLSCPLYSSERQILLLTANETLLDFHKKSLKNQFDILLYGLHPENPDYLRINTVLTVATQHFLMKIPRFET